MKLFQNIDLIRLDFFYFEKFPFGNDGDFSRDAIAQRINADLSNNFGNLIQRICLFINKNCNSTISNSSDYNEEDSKLLKFSINKFDKYCQYMTEQNIDKSLKEVFELLTETNIYVDKQAPWTLKKTNLERMNTVLFISLEIIRRSSLLLFPIMPQSCRKVLSMLNVDKKDITLKNYQIIQFKTYKINESHPIFPRIDIND